MKHSQEKTDGLTGERITKNTYYAIRHGHSEKNVLDLVVNYPEDRPYHLTDEGRAQVQQGAQWLKNKHIDLIFASDLTRTTESAQIVADVLGLKVQFDKRIREMNFGEFNGMNRGVLHKFFKNPDDVHERYTRKPPGGENWEDVTARMIDFLSDMERQYSGKNILVVSHGDPLWLMQWGSQCISLEELKNIPYPETGKPVLLDVKCPITTATQ